MQASAAFVSASALGMACCPALASLLQTKFKIYKVTFNEVTLPGWVMAIAWLFHLIWLCISFKEPLRDTEDSHESQEADLEPLESDALEKGLKEPLLSSSEEMQQDEDADKDCDASEDASDVLLGQNITGAEIDFFFQVC